MRSGHLVALGTWSEVAALDLPELAPPEESDEEWSEAEGSEAEVPKQSEAEAKQSEARAYRPSKSAAPRAAAKAHSSLAPAASASPTFSSARRALNRQLSIATGLRKKSEARLKAMSLEELVRNTPDLQNLLVDEVIEVDQASFTASPAATLSPRASAGSPTLSPAGSLASGPTADLLPSPPARREGSGGARRGVSFTDDEGPKSGASASSTGSGSGAKRGVRFTADDGPESGASAGRFGSGGGARRGVSFTEDSSPKSGASAGSILGNLPHLAPAGSAAAELPPHESEAAATIEEGDEGQEEEEDAPSPPAAAQAGAAASPPKGASQPPIARLVRKDTFSLTNVRRQLRSLKSMPAMARPTFDLESGLPPSREYQRQSTTPADRADSTPDASLSSAFWSRGRRPKKSGLKGGLRARTAPPEGAGAWLARARQTLRSTIVAGKAMEIMRSNSRRMVLRRMLMVKSMPNEQHMDANW
jgi:hypothetical protein